MSDFNREWEGSDTELLDLFDNSVQLLMEALGDAGIVFAEELSARKLMLEVLSLHSTQEIIRAKGVEIMQKERGDAPKVVTNGNWIRSLPDEKLAGMIMCQEDDGFSEEKCTGKSCIECSINWLRQPYEGGADDDV